MRADADSPRSIQQGKRKEGIEAHPQMPAYITPHENRSYGGMTN